MIIGIDPGRNIGVAFVHEDGRLERSEIITAPELAALEVPTGVTVVVGHSTGSGDIQAALRGRGIPFVIVDERNTSLEARELYLRDHPPKGPMRLLPRGLWSPPRPIDDYAAYAIALRYLDQDHAPA
ncbi:MAG TPA: hypothetical protein VF171_03685 [Trueperaceae bacterium]